MILLVADVALNSPAVELRRRDEATTLEAGVEVTCVYCYVTCVAAFEVEYANSTEIATFWDDSWTAIEEMVIPVTNWSSLADLDLDNITSVDADKVVNVTLPQFPAVNLHLGLSAVEIYAELQTVIHAGATFKLNLYTSQSLIGVSLEDVSIGAIFTVDLLLGADTSVTINSGFHIKLDEGVSFDLALFNENVTSLKMYVHKQATCC